MTERGTVVYGDDALRRWSEQIAADGVRRVLMVTGRRSFDASGAAAGLSWLHEVAEVVRWSEFDPNPSVDDLAAGLELARAVAPDAVIGVGGGSVMDMAKLLVAFESVPADRLVDEVRAGRRPEQRRVGLYLAPTTSGSGSEATHFAVVYVGDDKYSIAGAALRPDRVALEPTLAPAGSPHQRATSGLDAICQSIESLWAVGGTATSRRCARHALRLLVPAVQTFVVRGDDASARAMQIGSHLAGRAIDISKTTAAHALSYAITKGYDVDHGSAVALTLGQFIEDHAAADVRLQPGVDPDVHRRSLDIVLMALGAHDGSSARERFHALLATVGLPTSLASVGVTTEQELADIARSVNVERLGNNPVAYDVDGLIAVLRRAWSHGATA